MLLQKVTLVRPFDKRAILLQAGGCATAVKVAGDAERDDGDVPAGSTGTCLRLYLIRHGEVAYFGPGGGPIDPWQVCPTALGRAQAAGLAAALSGCGVKLLVTSAVPRAIETAAILVAGMGLTPVVDPGWNELRPGDLAVVPPACLQAVILGA